MALAGRGDRVEGFHALAPPPPAPSEAAPPAPQGVVASARPLPTLTLEALLARVTPPAVMVVDHLEDAHNLGAIARSVEAAGLAGLVVPGRRGVPLGPAAFKAAAGALERIGVTLASSLPSL